MAREHRVDAVRDNRRGGRGRGREGRGVDAQGLRHVHGRHLLRFRGHRHPHLALPPHGNLRAPHQAPCLPTGLPRRRQAPRRRSTPTWPEQAPEHAHGGGPVGAAGGGPVGADARAAVPDVPGAAGAAAAVVPQGRCALATARPPRFVHATLTYSSLISTEPFVFFDCGVLLLGTHMLFMPCRTRCLIHHGV